MEASELQSIIEMRLFGIKRQLREMKKERGKRRKKIDR